MRSTLTLGEIYNMQDTGFSSKGQWFNPGYGEKCSSLAFKLHFMIVDYLQINHIIEK